MSADLNLRARTVRGRRVEYRRLERPVGLYVYEGRIEGGDLQLWTALGYWRESGEPTDCDLVLAAAQEVGA